MKLKQHGLVVGAAVAMLFAMSSKSSAASLLLQNANLETPPAGSFVLGECADAGLCEPGDVLNLTYDPGSASTFAKNDTAFDFTKFIYTILPGQDAVWDSLSTFDFFNETEVSNDGKVLTLSDGVFASGATARFNATNSGDAIIDVAVSFEGVETTPEPATAAGLALAGVGGFYIRRRRQPAAG
jgi:hypothetical protein